MRAALYTLALVSTAAVLPAAAVLDGAYTADQAHAAQLAQPQGWSIVQYYKGDTFVIDHGLTHDDCDDAMPRNQAAKGLTFACELEAQ